MEKYYIVEKESSLYKEYFDCKSQRKAFNEAWKQFVEKVGITSNQYHQSVKRLMIVPSEEDLKKFKGQFKIDDVDGLREFKKNSVTYKAWKQFCEEEKLETPCEPWLFDYFHVYGKIRQKLFEIDGVLYCFFASNEYDFDNPKGFKEIKASEYHKVIEDYNSKLNMEAIKDE